MGLTDSLNKHIDNLITNQIFSSIYFKNGIRLRGHLIGQDETCVFLKKGKGNTQPLYKNRIETIIAEA